MKIINLLKMLPITRKASANQTVTESETENTDAVTKKNLREMIKALRSEIKILQDKQKELEERWKDVKREIAEFRQPFNNTPFESARPYRWWIRDILAIEFYRFSMAII